jgi:PAS domain-containing protein
VFAAHDLVDAVADVLKWPEALTARGRYDMDDAPKERIRTALQKMLTNGGLLNSLPIGVYCCEPDGTICNFNLRAAALWGRMPRIGETDERFCGAHKLFLPDGSPLPREKTPMAEALRIGKPAHDEQVIIERPDGSRVRVLVNIDPLYDEDGVLVGAVNCFQDIGELTGLDTMKSP